MDPSLSFTILTALKDGFADFSKTFPTVLSQTDPDFEWVIVDDDSRQPLAEAFPELASDRRVRILRNETGRGQTISLNKGIQAANGTWVVRMDGDDLCAPERLAAIRASVSNDPGAQLLFSDYRVIDEADRAWADVRMRHPLTPGFFAYLRARNNPICHPTVAFRRLKPGGAPRLFREDLVNAQDYALWCEILAECGPGSFFHLPSITLSYRIARNSLSGARAREQEVEKVAIREGQMLRHGEQKRPELAAPQKDAMQAYRLLYYRFVGESAPARFSEDLGLLGATLALPALFPRALIFLAMRPFRKLLLRRMFAGIYR